MIINTLLQYKYHIKHKKETQMSMGIILEFFLFGYYKFLWECLTFINERNKMEKLINECETVSNDLKSLFEVPTDKSEVWLIKLRLHTAINRADFVSWCMLYTYDGNRMHLWENDAVLS